MYISYIEWEIEKVHDVYLIFLQFYIGLQVKLNDSGLLAIFLKFNLYLLSFWRNNIGSW